MCFYVDVDDAFLADLGFESGSVGTVEATWLAGGQKIQAVLRSTREAQRSLQIGAYKWAPNFLGGRTADGDSGFTQCVHQPRCHFSAEFLAAGYIIGWKHTFVH